MNYAQLLTTLIVLPSWGEQLEEFPVDFVATEMNCGQNNSREIGLYPSRAGSS